MNADAHQEQPAHPKFGALNRRSSKALIALIEAAASQSGHEAGQQATLTRTGVQEDQPSSGLARRCEGEGKGEKAEKTYGQGRDPRTSRERNKGRKQRR